ncbi:hypothetical protein AB0M50_28105 [Nonomuraea fuscirosea]|uniref:hypothetical protein n=1 Tax=Nonomuraea fuscirosea TaxID=1291556 RepID=UPI003445DB54
MLDPRLKSGHEPSGGQWQRAAAARGFYRGTPLAGTDSAWQDDCRRRRPMAERAVARLVARGNRRLCCGDDPDRDLLPQSISDMDALAFAQVAGPEIGTSARSDRAGGLANARAGPAVALLTTSPLVRADQS